MNMNLQAAGGSIFPPVTPMDNSRGGVDLGLGRVVGSRVVSDVILSHCHQVSKWKHMGGS